MADTESPNTPSTHRLSAWLKQNRTRLQSLTLISALAAPFGLFWALQSGQNAIAVACFAVIVLALMVVIVTG